MEETRSRGPWGYFAFLVLGIVLGAAGGAAYVGNQYSQLVAGAEQQAAQSKAAADNWQQAMNGVTKNDGATIKQISEQLAECQSSAAAQTGQTPGMDRSRYTVIYEPQAASPNANLAKSLATLSLLIPSLRPLAILPKLAGAFPVQPTTAIRWVIPAEVKPLVMGAPQGVGYFYYVVAENRSEGPYAPDPVPGQ